MPNNLEQTSEKEMIPLVFMDMLFDARVRYKRLDTGEVLVDRVKILMPNMAVYVKYPVKETIRIKPAFPEANGLLFPEEPKPRELYQCNYAEIFPEEKEENETIRKIGSFSIPLKL